MRAEHRFDPKCLRVIPMQGYRRTYDFAATGLAAFDAGSGFHAVGVAAGFKYMFDPNWGVYTYAAYDRLIDGAADSPIVRTFGSRDQFSGGIGVFYTFNAGILFGG